MNYQIVDVYSDNIPPETIEKIKIFCLQALGENKHDARSNMQVDSWQENKASLLYLLLVEKRFLQEKGGLQLLVSDDEIVAVSGFYRSDFDAGIYLMGVRSWVLKKYRFNLMVATYLLPHQLEQIKKRGAHTAAISFNESTQAFAKLIARSNKNSEKDIPSKLKFFFGENYPDLYKDMALWNKPVKIKGVRQWVLIKKLLPSNFDWNTLNWPDQA